ncbi:hypothetical protein T484DRAFT_1618489, partial [Baffinella frigidus]
PETRNPKPETRNPKPETRNPKPETRNPKPETKKPNHLKRPRSTRVVGRLTHPVERKEDAVPGPEPRDFPHKLHRSLTPRELF